MENPKKVRVLVAFKPHIRILNAFNSENFEETNQCLPNILFSLCLAISAVLTPIVAILAIWYLVENDATMGAVVFAAGPIFTILQWFFTVLELTRKNRVISRTIQQIEGVVDERKFILNLLMTATS